MCLAAPGLKTRVFWCLPFFYDGSFTGLMLDCSVQQIRDNDTTAIYIYTYIIIERIIELMSTIYLGCFAPWTCPLARYDIFNMFEIIRQCYFVGNILKVKLSRMAFDS